jgi:hypothetical protein
MFCWLRLGWLEAAQLVVAGWCLEADVLPGPLAVCMDLCMCSDWL